MGKHCSRVNEIMYESDIFFDELDKISKTDKGDEGGLLTHLTDPVQNDKFHDQYFGDIELNLNSAFLYFHIIIVN